MRLTLTLTGAAFAAAIAVAVSSGAPGAGGTAPVFVLSGGGWGHGVGMSQWGAFGQAQAGRTAEQILATYYPGTELAKAAASKVRVLVAAATGSVRVESPVAFRVRAGDGTLVELPPGVADLDKRLRLLVDGARVALVGPVTVLPGPGALLQLGDTRYRGSLRVDLADGALRVVNVVALEAYLQGVVPGEMPKDWPLEALKAQAIAARTYAVAGLVRGKAYDLSSDVTSQVYYGVGREAPATTRAVRETRGLVLSFDGKPAQALYFSSSGGRTLSAVDVFGNELAYLVGVDDPWDDVVGNPNHRWEPRAFTGRQLARALKLSSPVVDVVYRPGEQGSPASMRFVTKTGAALDQRISELRYRLGLRSPSFRIGVLRLARPSEPASSGARVTLTGIARDVDRPQLERRMQDGSWKRAAFVRPKTDGAFSVVVRPSTTTTYRLSASGLAGPPLTLAVVEASE